MRPKRLTVQMVECLVLDEPYSSRSRRRSSRARSGPAGVLEVVETAKRRGALEHDYALTGPSAGIILGVMDMLATA